MKITIETAAFSAAIKRASRAAADTRSLPILGNLLITGETGEIKVAGTDLDLWIESKMKADFEGSFSVTSPAKRLSGIVSAFSSATIDFEITGDDIAISSGSSRFKLLGLPASEFPDEPIGEGEGIEIDAGHLADALASVAYCASTDETRWVLNSVHITGDEGQTAILATDGRRMAWVHSGLDWPFSPVVIPVKSVKEAIALLDGGKVTLDASSSLVIEGENWRLWSRLIEGNYPNWKAVMPRDPVAFTADVDRAAIISALSRVSIMADEKTETVNLEFATGSLTLRTRSNQVGDSVESVPVVGGGDCKIGVNCNYLMAAIRACKSDTVELGVISESDPIAINCDASKSIIMPMRIQ